MTKAQIKFGIELFYKFLLEKNALFNYLEYASIPTIKENVKPTYYLSMVNWVKSNEGYDYWDKLDDEFDEILMKNKLI